MITFFYAQQLSIIRENKTYNLLLSCFLFLRSEPIKASTDMTGSNLVQKTLTYSDEETLRGCFKGDRFFGFDADYPAGQDTEKDDSSVLSFTLIV
ncbi:MAG: hypothetical protein WCF46_14815, partial [Nitrososphaeraceae archaeon]